MKTLIRTIAPAVLLTFALITPASAAQPTSGSGSIDGFAGGEATFSFSIGTDGKGRLRGHVAYSDPSVDVQMRSTSIDSVFGVGCTLHFFFTSSEGEDWDLQVADNAPKGTFGDTFTIRNRSNPYNNANFLSSGDIRIPGCN